MSVVIYARYSTDHQRQVSIALDYIGKANHEKAKIRGADDTTMLKARVVGMGMRSGLATIYKFALRNQSERNYWVGYKCVCCWKADLRSSDLRLFWFPESRVDGDFVVKHEL